MLDRKQIWVTFLLEFKMGHKGVETTCNNVFGLGTANEYTVQCGSRGFAEEMRVLRMRSIVAGHRKLTMTN